MTLDARRRTPSRPPKPLRDHDRTPAQRRVADVRRPVPSQLTPATIRALQRSVGNHATQRILQRSFWEHTSADKYVWHDSDPDPALFVPVIDASGQIARYSRWNDLFSYEVYEAAPAPGLHPPSPQAPPPRERRHPAPAAGQPVPDRQPGAGRHTEPRRKRDEPAPAPTAVPPLVDPPGRLLKQFGPSCWLFVIEAIAKVRGLDTRLFATALQLYPAGAEAKGKGRRALIAAMATSLAQVRARMPDTLGPVSWERAQLQTQRAGIAPARIVPFTHRLLAPLRTRDGTYKAGDIRAELGRAIKLVERLGEEIAKQGPHDQDEEAKLLGGAKVDIAAGESLATFGLVLSDHLRRYGPCMLGIREHFRPREYDNDQTVHPRGSKDYDFTRVSPARITEGGAHAVFLIDCDTSTGIVRYKDPNSGDAMITITLGHVARMAELWGKVEVYPLFRQAAQAPSIENVLK